METAMKVICQVLVKGQRPHNGRKYNNPNLLKRIFWCGYGSHNYWYGTSSGKYYSHMGRNVTLPNDSEVAYWNGDLYFV